MRINHIKLLISMVLFIVSTMAHGFEVPKLNARVNDNANMFSARVVNALEAKLAQLETKTSIQIAILTIDSLKGANLESASIETANAWALGRRGKDDGLLIFIAKKERKIRIEVGAGLEGIITDAAAGRIIDNIMRPNFKEENFDRGIVDAVNKIINLTGATDISSIKNVEKTLQMTKEDSAEAITRFLLYLVFLAAMLVVSYYSDRPLNKRESIQESKNNEITAPSKPLEADCYLPVCDVLEEPKVNIESSESVSINKITRNERNAMIRANLLAVAHGLICPFFILSYRVLLTEAIPLYIMFAFIGYFLGRYLFISYSPRYSLFSRSYSPGFVSKDSSGFFGCFKGGGGGFRGGGSSGGW